MDSYPHAQAGGIALTWPDQEIVAWPDAVAGTGPARAPGPAPQRPETTSASCDVSVINAGAGQNDMAVM
jgi:hypothetical protein